jgi:lysosomal acid lipase/cholesteryl ester hydrolase
MPSVPFIGRLHIHEYLALGGSFVLLFLEVVIRTITLLLPTPIIRFCYRVSRNAFNRLSSPYSRRARNRKKAVSSPIAQADDFVELCELYGYYAEEHVVQTEDGYLLGVHRLGWRKGEEDQKVNAGPDSIQKKVVYLHHGLMMNSEVWVCLTEQERCLPFLLVDQGYDVWLGNNRGNKYSKKSLNYGPTEVPFWNFSMDQFAFHDIPDSINYILTTTEQPSLSYIGFSQGTAQAFATLSIHPTLNQKVDVFVALAPAMAPPGLASGIVSSMVKSNPEVLFLAFGRRAILGSTTMWQALLYPGIFSYVIDKALGFLFGWKMANITPHQKLAAYPHLYSFTSTKSVVHWFQIIRNGKFQMYDDEVTSPTSFSTASKYYKVAKFPTRNIKTPIVLVYGGSDCLVDINLMLKELPKHTIAKCIPKYEHLDLLWASDVDTLVFPHVLEALDSYAMPSSTKQDALEWTQSLAAPRRNIFDSAPSNGSLPPGYSEDENVHGMPQTPAIEWERPSTAEEQMDESDEEDYVDNGQGGLMLAPSSFAHSSSNPPLTKNGLGLLSNSTVRPSHRSTVSTSTTGTAIHLPLHRQPPMLEDSLPQRPNEYDGAESFRSPQSPLESESVATDHTVVRSRPEGWWSSTNSSSMTSLVEQR